MAAGSTRAGGEGGAPRFVVPFLRHTGFVGREEDLARVHELLQEGQAVGLRPVAAAGMGGIGKTQLAVEYAYRHGDDYPGGVYWVNAARHVQGEMAALAAEVGLFAPEAKDSELQLRLALAFVRFLDERPDALVILDNVEDPKSLRNERFGFVPAQLRCRVLFTSRRTDGGFATVAVGVLPEDKALELLAGGAGRVWEGAELAAALEVCRMLGCLPLALALAGAFLERNPEISVEGYRERLRAEGALAAVDAAGLAEDDLPTRHAAAVEATLRLDWDALAKLPGGGEAERRVLQAAALLGEAAEVPRARLALLTGLGERAEKSGYPAPLGVALRRLGELSLVEMLGEKPIRLHPLVREFAENRIEGRDDFAAECAGNLGEALWEMGRLNDEVAGRGVDAVLVDLRVGLRLSRKGEARWIERLMRQLDREAHCLRKWKPEERPEFLLQQMRNRCFEMGEEAGRELAEYGLAKRGLRYLRERVRSGRESEALVRTLEGHTFYVTGVALTPDGRRAVSASQDHTLRVWDVESGELVRTLEGHIYSVTGVTLTPDGRRAVSASTDRTLKVWDVESGGLVCTLEGHTLGVTGVALTSDGQRAVSASWDKTLKVWDVESGNLLRTLEGHMSGVAGVALMSDGQRAVSASDDHTLKVWEVESGKLVDTLKGHAAGVAGVALTSDGRRAVSASWDKTLKVWDVDRGELERTLEGHTSKVSGVALTPNGRLAVSASYDKTLKVWDVKSGELIRTFDGHTENVAGLALTPDGRLVVSASNDKTLKVWEVESGVLERPLECHASYVAGLALTADGRRAVSASWDETLKVWDVESGALVRTLKGHTSSVIGVALTWDGQRAVSTSWDDTLKVWDVESGALVRTLEGHTSWVTDVVLTWDGRRAVSTSSDKTLKVWDVESGELLRTFEGHTDRVAGLALTSDGQRAVSASWDDTLKVWDVDSGEVIRTLVGHTLGVTRVMLTSDGQHAVSASFDKTLKVWNVESGELVRTLEGHTAGVSGAAATADGRWAHSVSFDKTIRIWDLASGPIVATLEAHAPLSCCAVASDRRILVGDRLGALHILDWHTPTTPTHPPPPVLRPQAPKPPALPQPHNPAPQKGTTMALQVSGPQYQQLNDALAKAFPARAKLERMLQFRLRKELNEIAGEGQPIVDTVFEVIRAANAEGWTLQLVNAARASNPGNPHLFTFAQSLGLAPATPASAGLERLIKQSNSYLDLQTWRTRLAEIEAQVCRVEVGKGSNQGFGTGFLVGPDLLITNHHVLAPVLAGHVDPADVTLRFDYKRLTTGNIVNPGTEHKLAKDWLLDESPPSPLDVGFGDADPAHLDYALVRLEGSPGDAPIGKNAEHTAPARRWIVPAATATLSAGAPLFIVQHPKAEPIKLALDTDALVGLNGNGTRVRYRTNTEPGSSGSPCFDQHWNLVALHHAGDTLYPFGHAAAFNEGIPLARIVERLARPGVEITLPPLPE